MNKKKRRVVSDIPMQDIPVQPIKLSICSVSSTAGILNTSNNSNTIKSIRRRRKVKFDDYETGVSPIDLVARVVIPLAYFAFNLYFWLVYMEKRHSEKGDLEWSIHIFHEISFSFPYNFFFIQLFFHGKDCLITIINYPVSFRDSLVVILCFGVLFL